MIEDEMAMHETNRWSAETIQNVLDSFIDWKALYKTAQAKAEAAEAENAKLLRTLEEIDFEAFNTIPPDGKEAAFAALTRISKLIDPYRKFK